LSIEDRHMFTHTHCIRLLIALPGSLLLSAAPVAARAQTATRTPTDSVPGPWTVAVTTQEATFTCALRLIASGARVTGTLDCPQGKVDVAGHADANRFVIGFLIATGDSIYYDGVVAGDSVHGTWRQPGYSGTFRGRRNGLSLEAPALHHLPVQGSREVDQETFSPIRASKPS
jgi:hypothetical protein